MTVRKARKPPGLGGEGGKLWDEVTSQLADDGLELDVRERRWLLDACREADLLADLEANIVGEPRVVKGSQGQPVAHPLLAEIRQHREALSRLLARVSTDEPAEQVGRGGRTSKASARKAAMSRHYGRGSGLGGA